MSTLKRDDLEQHSAMDLDPYVGLHRPSSVGTLRPHEESGDERAWKDVLCHAICVGNWSDTKFILDVYPNALTAKISDKSRTSLHVAAMFGHVTILEELLKLLPQEFLRTPDNNGDTALTLATWYSESTQVAKCLVEKNRATVCIPNNDDQLPVIVAIKNGYREMGRYLYSVTPLECLKNQRGSSLLHFCFREQCFDIALHLLQQCQELLLVPNGEGTRMPIHDIATLNTVIPSPSGLIFWKRWIYSYKKKPSATAIHHVSLDIQQEDRGQADKAKFTKQGIIGLLLRLVVFSDTFVGIKKIQELKLLHAQADELLRLVCENARKAYQKEVIYKALCYAAKEGNAEFVSRVSKVIPEIFTSRTFLSVFNEALHYRQARVFNLIHGLRFKNSVVSSITGDGTSLMHKAATKAPDHVLNRIYAPTLRMQRELQWFKEVESLTPLGLRATQDYKGMTAEELFRESHRELMKEGEKWIKDTASSCSVVGTLIVTIMFAAAFTVPGGNDQNHGYPLLIEQPFFKVFTLSTILSLLFSSTSVLIFLAILTSQFSEEKFLKSLPTKLILGISFLFISIASMMVAFLSTIRLMLQHTNYSWGLIPITILASVPISLFVLSQFPLLLDTYVATYGNLFDKKAKLWP